MTCRLFEQLKGNFPRDVSTVCVRGSVVEIFSSLFLPAGRY